MFARVGGEHRRLGVGGTGAAWGRDADRALDAGALVGDDDVDRDPAIGFRIAIKPGAHLEGYRPLGGNLGVAQEPDE